MPIPLPLLPKSDYLNLTAWTLAYQENSNNLLKAYFPGVSLSALSATFTDFGASSAALEEALGGTTITATLNNGSQTSYTVTGYSAQLQQALAGVSNLPPQNSGAWEGLLSLYFNSPKLIGSKLVAALNADDLSEAWYQIRYTARRRRAI